MDAQSFLSGFVNNKIVNLLFMQVSFFFLIRSLDLLKNKIVF